MSETTTAAKPGDRMDDGTMYAGISPDTNEPMYTTKEDAPLLYTFNEAAGYAEKLNAENYLGNDDWRVPTKGELNVLFNNREAIGGFNLDGGFFPCGCWHWSCTENGKVAWMQRFRGGDEMKYSKDENLSLRCVRG